jgi:tRNA pseudouridine13 synthase
MLPRGVIKSSPEDFVVEEVPLYAPSGAGDHLYIRFTKRGLTTDEAVRAMARELGVNARDAGVAGLKDKVGVTTQTISLQPPRGAVDVEARALALAIPGVIVHEAKRHGNKLRTGHLAGNRFTVTVRGVPRARAAEAIATIERVGREGAPNAFGTQRFGRQGDNAERAQAWIRGEWRGPRDARARRFLWSSLQSAIFNDVLGRRVADGTWTTPLEGDVLQKEDSGGLFLCADVQADRARAERGEVSPTGPMPGVKMRSPTGAPLALETEVTSAWLGHSYDFASVRSFAEGTRRALRVLVRELSIERIDGAQANENTNQDEETREQASNLRVHFVLPKGAYATTVLSAAFAVEEPRPDEPAPSTDAAAPESGPDEPAERD